MKVALQIKKVNSGLIKAGTKKTEWCVPSDYNKKMLLKRNAEGKYAELNHDITEVEFLNGYRKDREKLTITVKRIRAVKFSRDIDIPEDNFKALSGQTAIEITLVIFCTNIYPL